MITSTSVVFLNNAQFLIDRHYNKYNICFWQNFCTPPLETWQPILPKIVVFGVQQSNQSGVDGTLVRQFDGTLGQNLQDFCLVSGQICFQYTGQSFKVWLQGSWAFFTHSQNQRFQSIFNLDVIRYPSPFGTVVI